MFETETYIEKAKERRIDVWNKTTEQLKRQEGNESQTIPALRRSPQAPGKASGKNSGTKFKRKADYLVSVSADKADYKERVGDKGEKYSGSLCEAFDNQKKVVSKVSIKQNAKLIWAKVAESDVVPCLPDIFLKIICTDDISPCSAR